MQIDFGLQHLLLSKTLFLSEPFFRSESRSALVSYKKVTGELNRVNQKSKRVNIGTKGFWGGGDERKNLHFQQERQLALYLFWPVGHMNARKTILRFEHKRLPVQKGSNSSLNGIATEDTLGMPLSTWEIDLTLAIHADESTLRHEWDIPFCFARHPCQWGSTPPPSFLRWKMSSVFLALSLQ